MFLLCFATFSKPQRNQHCWSLFRWFSSAFYPFLCVWVPFFSSQHWTCHIFTSTFHGTSFTWTIEECSSDVEHWHIHLLAIQRICWCSWYLGTLRILCSYFDCFDDFVLILGCAGIFARSVLSSHHSESFPKVHEVKCTIQKDQQFSKWSNEEIPQSCDHSIFLHTIVLFYR